MAGQNNGSTSNTKETLTMSMKTGTSTSPTLEELKKDLFVAIEILNGYTESEALLNWKCVQGTCQCP